MHFLSEHSNFGLVTIRCSEVCGFNHTPASLPILRQPCADNYQKNYIHTFVNQYKSWTCK